MKDQCTDAIKHLWTPSTSNLFKVQVLGQQDKFIDLGEENEANDAHSNSIMLCLRNHQKVLRNENSYPILFTLIQMDSLAAAIFCVLLLHPVSQHIPVELHVYIVINL